MKICSIYFFAAPKIQDVSLVCEGAFEFLGPKELLKGGNRDRTYQTSYIYRADGATREEMYLKGPIIDVPFIHSIKALRRDKIEELSVNPDTRALGKARVIRGNSKSMRDSGSPNFILYLWFFRSLEDLIAKSYEFQGWEAIGGENCLRVEFDYLPGLKGRGRPRIRFWVDLRRGAHPLRVETFWNGKLMMRVDGIKLEQFKVPRGGEVWLPVDGTVEHFAWGRNNYKSPVYRETYHVVTGMVRLNRGLGDDVFSVKWKDGTPETAGFAALRRAFDDASSHTVRVPMDHDSVRKRLDEKLAEADAQAAMLEASSPARVKWSWTVLVQLGTAFIGVSCLVLAGVRKWRAR